MRVGATVSVAAPQGFSSSSMQAHEAVLWTHSIGEGRAMAFAHLVSVSNAHGAQDATASVLVSSDACANASLKGDCSRQHHVRLYGAGRWGQNRHRGWGCMK